MGCRTQSRPSMMRGPFVALACVFWLGGRAAGAPNGGEERYNIALLHMFDGVSFFSRLGTLTGQNKERYATQHGYDMVFHTPTRTTGLLSEEPCGQSDDPVKIDGRCYADNQSFKIDDRAPTFGKIKLALAACIGRKNYWLLWSDADALITNPSVKLEDLIDDSKDIMLTYDWLMINAGVILLKCSDWNIAFLEKVYADRSFDKANALDQSAFDHYFASDPSVKSRLKYVPKHLLNVYPEEYIPGDFLVHCAGKLYEAGEAGAVALAQQFDAFSRAEDLADVEAFFATPYLLNYYSGTCVDEAKDGVPCPPEDTRRIKLPEPMKDMARPNRYRHVGERYHWLKDWKDVHDVPGWNDDRVPMTPRGSQMRQQDGGHEEL